MKLKEIKIDKEMYNNTNSNKNDDNSIDDKGSYHVEIETE